MKRLSFGKMWVLKVGFPAVFLATLIGVSGNNILAGDRGILDFVFPLALLLALYVVMKRLVFDLMDEVWDGGDYLVVRYRGGNMTIPYEDIREMRASENQAPHRITLFLQEEGRFGDKIAFCPQDMDAVFRHIRSKMSTEEE